MAARNVLITLCYDGSGYHGWQVQQNAVSVQQVFQEAPGSSVSGCSWKALFPASGCKGP